MERTVSIYYSNTLTNRLPTVSRRVFSGEFSFFWLLRSVTNTMSTEASEAAIQQVDSLVEGVDDDRRQRVMLTTPLWRSLRS